MKKISISNKWNSIFYANNKDITDEFKFIHVDNLYMHTIIMWIIFYSMMYIYVW